MLAALKDIITAIAAITLLAYATGQQDWLWKQIATLRREALVESQKDWGCPSVFNQKACQTMLIEAGRPFTLIKRANLDSSYLFQKMLPCKRISM